MNRFLLTRLAAAFPVVVGLCGAVDAALVRREFPWRPLGAELFLQALLLWGVFASLAALPAFLCARSWLRRRAAAGHRGGEVVAAAAASLLGWTTLPVVLHALLDRHVAMGADFRAFAAPRPWLELGAGVAALALLLAATVALLRRFPAKPLALAAALVALVLGLPLGFGRLAAEEAGDARPNLLLLIWDTCRSDKLQPYGYARETTPHLARFAEEALVFEDSVSTACFTLSSHVSLLTGVLPAEHGARLIEPRYDPRRAESVAELLRQAGYRTGAFVGTDVLVGRSGIRHGFEHYDDQVDPPVCDTRAWRLVHDLQTVAARLFPALNNDGNPHWFQDFQRPARDVLERASSWIRADDPRPWFCMVNLYDVHWPYLPEDEGRQLVAPYDGPLDGYLFRSDDWDGSEEITERDRRHVAQLYEGELLELDREVERFLATLELERGETAVLMTSDHGEAFGEGGRWKHEDIIEPQVRVPLLLRLAEPRPEGRRIADPVSGVDVGPTLLALAGVEPPEGIDGRSLLERVPPDRVRWVEDRDHMHPEQVAIALYRGPWKLVRRGLGDDAWFELFDLRADPLGVRDVKAEHPDVLAELAALLEARRSRYDEADAESGEGVRGALEGLEALGYVGG